MNNLGFTLIELLVVIAIIGILAASGMATSNYAKNKALKARTQSDLAQISEAINILANDSVLWPGAQTVEAVNTGANNEICGPDINNNSCVSGLSASTSGIVANDGSFNNWEGPYIYKMPKDPWGFEYFFDTDYQLDANGEPCGCGGGGCVDAVVLGSYGPDGKGAPNGADGSYGCDDIIRLIYRE